MKYGESVVLRKHTKKFSRFDFLFKKFLKTRIFCFLYVLKYVSNLKKKTENENRFTRLFFFFNCTFLFKKIKNRKWSVTKHTHGDPRVSALLSYAVLCASHKKISDRQTMNLMPEDYMGRDSLKRTRNLWIW